MSKRIHTSAASVRSQRRTTHQLPLSAMHSLLLAIALGVSTSTAAQVQSPKIAADYPSKTIRMLVGFPPGGGTDVTARMFGQKFFDVWGQNVVVDNRSGAGGNIATELVAKAVPDGHTLLMAVSSIAINPSLYKISYDTLKDLAPISMVAFAPNIIVVHPSVPVQTVRDLVAYAKTKPAQLTYASPGSGQASHLAMELFALMTGTQFIHVPYNGGGPSVIAALAGQTQLLTGAMPTVLPHVRVGKLKAMGITSAKRTQLAPDIPTIAEAAGLPGYEADVWYGMLAPAGTPAPIINKLNAEIDKVLQQKDVREKLVGLGYEPFRDSPAEFAAFMKAEIAKWGKVVRQSGARVD
jgi:tripartite-type tricarboxylate transporter receptor subunit TctC